MKINEIRLTESAYPWLTAAQQAFAAVGVPYVAPYQTNAKELHTGKSGKHRGIYLLFQTVDNAPVFYYIGLAKSPTATIYNRFQTHYAKLTVNLVKLYGTLVQKKETRWQFPKGWREGIKAHFLSNVDDIPDYWSGRQKHDFIQPINHEWIPIFKVEIDHLPLLLWNLNHLTPEQIDSLETSMIRAFNNPLFNGAKTH